MSEIIFSLRNRTKYVINVIYRDQKGQLIKRTSLYPLQSDKFSNLPAEIEGWVCALYCTHCGTKCTDQEVTLKYGRKQGYQRGPGDLLANPPRCDSCYPYIYDPGPWALCCRLTNKFVHHISKGGKYEFVTEPLSKRGHIVGPNS
jgi:hypothetical protein